MSESEERTPEHPGCVLGIAFGLLLVAALVAVSLFAAGRVVEDPRSFLEETFAIGELPFELQFVEAVQLPGGDHLVRLAHPDHVTPEPEPESGDDPDPAPSDAKKVVSYKPPPRPEMTPDTPPTEVFLALYEDPEDAVRAFRSSGGGGSGGRGRGSVEMSHDWNQSVQMDGGDLEWGELRAGYLHERKFEGETAHDEVRVNLSGKDRYCVLFARWPTNHAGSRERVEELLGSFSIKSD